MRETPRRRPPYDAGMIKIQNLSKTYRSLVTRRSVAALDDVSFTVAPGEVIGIAGPNGAGKSTLISLLLGFLHPTAGTTRIGGLAPRAYVERYGVAYLAELVAIPPKWTVQSTLERMASLGGVPTTERRMRVELLLERLDLSSQRAKQVYQLSKGNRQRLGLAQALITDRDLVVLDEPTYGLDPVWTQRFRELVQELRRPTRTMLIASHNLDELERLADRVLILHRGRVERVFGPGNGIVSSDEIEYRIKLAGRVDAIGTWLPNAEPVEGRPGEWRVRGDVATLNAALAELIESGASIVSFAPEQSRLESEFRIAMESDQ